MALKLEVGGDDPALIQSGSIVTNSGALQISPTLPSPSRAGTTLLFVAGFGGVGGAASVAAMPPGWSPVWIVEEGANTELEVWQYPSNPGGISALTAILVNSGLWYAHLSEWSNISSFGGSDFAHANTATAGSTLTPGNELVTESRTVAISAWVQREAASTAAAFTSPSGFTRLADNGATASLAHLDIEYQLSPTVGSLATGTLTSSVATVSAAGIIAGLTPARARRDITSYLAADGMTLKQNTFDFRLRDMPFGTITPNDVITLHDPDWIGRVASIHYNNLVPRPSGHNEVSITATNGDVAVVSQPPADLSIEATLSGGLFLLEDGSGSLLLETGDYLYQEGTEVSARNVTFRESISTAGASVGEVTLYATAETFQDGFAPGQTPTVNALTNFGLEFQLPITNVTATWVGAPKRGGKLTEEDSSGAFLLEDGSGYLLQEDALPIPVFFLEFGDDYQTLQSAGAGILANDSSQAVIQQGTAIPAGVLGYAQSTTTQAPITTEVDVTGCTYTVTVSNGRRIKVTGFIGETDSSIGGDYGILRIYEDGLAVGTSAFPYPSNVSETSVTCSAIRTPTAGSHTYKLTIARLTGTGVVRVLAIMGSPYILVEDIGT